MAEEKVFPKEISMFAKKDNQPSFVLGEMVINVDEIAMANEQYLSEYKGKRQLKIQVLISKENKPYLVVNTWKPTKDNRTGAELKAANDAVSTEQPSDDLPF